jgi:hypothetical protein
MEQGKSLCLEAASRLRHTHLFPNSSTELLVGCDSPIVVNLFLKCLNSYSLYQVTTAINNLIIGKLYCHHHGTMSISGNRQYSCKLTFKQQSFLERNPRQVKYNIIDCSHDSHVFTSLSSP